MIIDMKLFTPKEVTNNIILAIERQFILDS